jgi:hypothetical protein
MVRWREVCGIMGEGTVKLVLLVRAPCDMLKAAAGTTAKGVTP